jgi:osmotically inducible lipoprotein OsmB
LRRGPKCPRDKAAIAAIESETFLSKESLPLMFVTSMEVAMTKNTVAILGVVLALSACGYNRGERALSGAAIGAGAGALGAAVLGANPATGAIVGGGVGAATGAFTDPDDVNLDRRDRRRR